MPKRTVLYKAHQDYGAEFTDFGGYEMPVRYKGATIIDEHLAVRQRSGMFDVSHMGRYWVTGTDAKEFLDLLVPRDVMALTPGRAGYTFMLNEVGGFKDDVIISQLDETEFMVVCNAGNRDKIWNWMGSLSLVWRNAGKDVVLEDRSDISSMIAVQGPRAMSILEELAGESLPDKRFRLVWVTILGIKVLVSTTGYTGENGAELIVLATQDTIVEQSIKLWNSLLDKEVIPCALGARDTLRLEAGYCLYGNDIDETTHLLESGLDFRPFAIIDKAHEYIGQHAVLSKQDISRKRVGFKLLGRGIPRHGMDVLINDEVVGVVCSGTKSPISDEPIGMAYVPLSHKDNGSTFFIDIGRTNKRKLVEAEVISFPIYDTTKFGGSRTA